MDIGFETLSLFRQARHYTQWWFDLSRPYLKGEILEVGCGIGTFTQFLTTLKGVKVFCIDSVPEYIAMIQKDLGLEKARVGDITDLNTFWQGELYDTIVCANVLEHIVEDELALRNMRAILKKQGRVVLGVPAYQSLYGSLDRSVGHVRRYELNDLMSKCKRAGFGIEKKRYLNICGITSWFYYGKILKRQIIPEFSLKLYNLILPWLRTLETSLGPPAGLSVILVLRREEEYA